jgi:hypothetical protein
VSIIACTTADVLGHGCICKESGWEHEWGPAYPPIPSRPNLHWCANCDCCAVEMEPAPDADGGTNPIAPQPPTSGRSTPNAG